MCATRCVMNKLQSTPCNLCNSKPWMDVLPQLHEEQQAGKYLWDTSVYRSSFDCEEYNSSNCRGGEFLQEHDTSSSTWLQPINYAQARKKQSACVSAGLGDNPHAGCHWAGLKLLLVVRYLWKTHTPEIRCVRGRELIIKYIQFIMFITFIQTETFSNADFSFI